MRESELSSLFEIYSPVISLDLKKDPVTGKRVGYGFIELET
jgi:RNA recognition motif-containing protein